MAEEIKKEGVPSRPGGYISKIVFNNGEAVDIEKNDIVIFVGPNNSGKSQSLKDIYELADEKKPTVVISGISIEKSATQPIGLLQAISQITDHGSYKRYSGLGFDVTSGSVTSFGKEKSYGPLRPLFIKYLDTENRLKICRPAESIRKNAPKQHPIHYVAFNGKYRRWLSENYKKAFGKDVYPHMQYGKEIPLCIGDPVKFGSEYDGVDEQERQEAFATILDTYQQVQYQGDGIKSFTGILLYLMLDYYNTYLIDEPESFLHPPQANIMGQIIGSTLTNEQQAVISTHSEEIIKGLLSTCPERIKIIRITRVGDENSFSILNNERLNDVWNDPLLKHSNIMQSLFHQKVALCESDSDCKIYSIVDNHLKQQKGKYSETLFVHCGGKHRMSKIATALRSLNVDVTLIPDMDIMNDEQVFKGVVEAFGITWDMISREYNIVVSSLHSPKETVNRNDAKTTINRILDEKAGPDLSKKELAAIREAIRITSKWEPIKKTGEQAIPSGEPTVAFRQLNQVLREHGIYLVPVGELEGFVKEVGGHGPDWANEVLEKYPDLTDPVYDRIKEFIGGIGL